MERASCARLLLTPVLLSLTAVAWAWKPAKDTVGPITVTIEDIADIDDLTPPLTVNVDVKNASRATVTGQLRVGLIDGWQVRGSAARAFSVKGEGAARHSFEVIPAQDSYAAHYPVHAYATFTSQGRALTAHAVYIVQVTRRATGAGQRRPEGLGALTALHVEGQMSVDGSLGPQEWAGAIPTSLGRPELSTGELSPGDFGAIARILHDGANLYLGLSVTDDDLSADDITSRDYVNSDYIRLYLSARPPALRTSETLTGDDLVLAINPLAAGGPVKSAIGYGYATRAVADMSEIRVAARPTPAGYEAEVAVPLALVGKGISVGDTIGFNLMLGDADAGHRQAEVTIGSQQGAYWTDPRCYVSLALSPRTRDDGLVSLPVTAIAGEGATALDRLGLYRVTVAQHGKDRKVLPLGWTGSDKDTGAHFSPGHAARPDDRPAIVIHPPYRNGVGRMWAEARFSLPQVTPIALNFATAIRDSTTKEPPSDGVEWRVQVADVDGTFREVFKRFSASKTWQDAGVDLSQYAGKTVTLRLWNGPGPNSNTVCDSGYWGAPTLVVGELVEPEAPQAAQERADRAVERARQALAGRRGRFQWRVENAAGKFGVGWAAGPYGFGDGALAFATKDQAVVFDTFYMEINGHDVRDPRSPLRVIGGKAAWNPDLRASTIQDFVADRDADTVTVWSSMWAEKGAFKLRFSMPTQERDAKGAPRFTRLGVGPASVKARRVFAGFGNVIQDPDRFTLRHGGFQLSTRHVGMEFDNGISLVQASDVFPYEFVVDPEQKLYSLRTGHDTTMTFVPSAKGAFAAARLYRDVAGFSPAGGVAKLKGKMCIDWWGGHDIADDIRRAAAYGLHDCVFIKHAWQRHGYDYRLPDVYPPACDPKVWDDWVNACRGAGMLFGVHDNYIDFYPDASDFSYKHILFNGDGTPQKAWYHTGYKAQSYRWLPGAYNPWLERNIKLIKEGFAPTAYFIDVFSAIPPLDYYDSEGVFHTKMECIRHWAECFDYVRRRLGDDAPQISEAGHDALVGHLDGCQSDHYSAASWGWRCGDAQRVPWHDMATHESFVLLAGGLGSRYSGGEPLANYGSDDYLCNTVIGGRNPMCVGPCTRDTVMTYWLQHDICDELAHQSLETHEFVGDDIHRQHTTFGGGGQAWTNRGEGPWHVEGRVLPHNGYLAISGDVQSDISLRGGLPTGYAHSPVATFVDARPESLDIANRAPVRTRVLSAEYLGHGQVRCEVQWDVLKPLPEGYAIFVHVCHDKVTGQGEKIAVHSGMDLPPEKLQQVGVHRCTTSFRITDDLWEGDYYIRYGLYAPKLGGGRLSPIAYMDGSRVRGGILTVTKGDGKVDNIDYAPEIPQDDAPLLNTEGKMIDFGSVVTNGAFRLLHSGEEWTLLPLQGSFPFKAEIELGQLGAEGRRVSAVEGLDQKGAHLGEEQWKQDADTLKLDLDAEAFSYRIAFE